MTLPWFVMGAWPVKETGSPPSRRDVTSISRRLNLT